MIVRPGRTSNEGRRKVASTSLRFVSCTHREQEITMKVRGWIDPHRMETRPTGKHPLMGAHPGGGDE
jgi:hypothetical protein